MSEVSKRQIGGSHYGEQYNHWDWVVDCKLGYLEGCASKYVLRYLNKNGIEDLDKAEHYLDKMMELFISEEYYPDLRITSWVEFTHKLVNQNNLTNDQAKFMFLSASWNCEADIMAMKQIILFLRNAEDAKKQGLLPQGYLTPQQPLDATTDQKTGGAEHIKLAPTLGPFGYDESTD